MKFLSKREQEITFKGQALIQELHNIRALTEVGKPVDLSKLQQLTGDLQQAHKTPHLYKCLVCKTEFAPGDHTHAEIITQYITSPDGRTTGTFPLSARCLAICQGCWKKSDMDSYFEYAE